MSVPEAKAYPELIPSEAKKAIDSFLQEDCIAPEATFSEFLLSDSVAFFAPGLSHTATFSEFL